MSPLIVTLLLAAVPSAGLQLPEGFSATVFHEGVGRARHIAVAPDGRVFVRLRSGDPTLVVLRDADGDGRAEQLARFGNLPGGTGIEVFEGWLYVSTDRAVYRWKLPPLPALAPAGEPELIVDGMLGDHSHDAKSLAIDADGGLFVNNGAPSNACQSQDRRKGSPGQQPCPQLQRAGGVWRFEARKPGQQHGRDGKRIATGVRNAVALAWDPASKGLFAVPHGRDQLNTLFPDLYSVEDNAELPAEEFHRLREGTDAGWPYTYWDQRQGARVIAPEYGGDGKRRAEPGRYLDPLVAFPGHWAPNDLLFLAGRGWPARYRGGALIAFHGSWNRAPLPQRGYKVVFVPFANGKPTGPPEDFATGFPGKEPLASPSDAAHRPMGLAEGPDGALYIADSVRGRVWRVMYREPAQSARPSLEIDRE